MRLSRARKMADRALAYGIAARPRKDAPVLRRARRRSTVFAATLVIAAVVALAVFFCRSKKCCPTKT